MKHFFFLLFVGWNLDVMAGAQAVFWEFKQLKSCAEENEAQWKDPTPWSTIPADLLSYLCAKRMYLFLAATTSENRHHPVKLNIAYPMTQQSLLNIEEIGACALVP